MSVQELHDAARAGNLGQIRRLVQEEEMVDVNARHGWWEQTALHAAARYGQSDTIQFLIDSKADIEARDRHGETALHVAAAYGQTEAVQLLVDSQADINAKDQFGKTPLHNLAFLDDVDAVAALFDHLRSTTTSSTTEKEFLKTMSAKDEDNQIPFHCVESPEMAKLFLEQPPLSTNGVPCICRDQLVSKGRCGLTLLKYWLRREEARDDARDENPLCTYLRSYTDLPLAVPAASLTPTHEVAVRINPELTEFQRKLAEDFFKKSVDVLSDLFEEIQDDDSDPSDGEPRFFLPDNVRCVIIGHLALADIMFLDDEP